MLCYSMLLYCTLRYSIKLNTVTPNFVAIFVFFGTASFIERISSSETEAKQEAI